MYETECECSVDTHTSKYSSTTPSHLFLARPKQAVVSAGTAGEASLEEGDIEEGGVEVDELQDVQLERETTVVLRLSAQTLPVSQLPCHVATCLQ